MKVAQKNIHIPLTPDFYSLLKNEAERLKKPLSQIAREAIIQWLKERKKRRLHDQIHHYASVNSGVTDLDSDLESASVKHLLEEEKKS